MTPLQLELTKLIGKKELTFGCLIDCQWFWPYITIHWDLSVSDSVSVLKPSIMWYDKTRVNIGREQIIGHPATLSDFHRWMNEKYKYWFEHRATDNESGIEIRVKYAPTMDCSHIVWIPYNSSKDLLDQEVSTLEQIISLIKENK